MGILIYKETVKKPRCLKITASDFPEEIVRESKMLDELAQSLPRVIKDRLR